VNLNVNYNFALAKMKVNLIVLASELKSFSFLVLMYLKVSQGEPKPQGVRQPFSCILGSFNNILEVLINELLNALPPYKKVDPKIEVVVGSISLSNASYWLNQKELEKFKKN
jgi:hypothetical protein